MKIQSALMSDSFWASDRVQESPSHGKPFVRPVKDNEDPKRFRVTFLVFDPSLREESQVSLTYYGLDFKDCKRKMEIDTDYATFRVQDVVDTWNDYHQMEAA